MLPSPAPSSHSSKAMDGTFCQLILQPWYSSEPCAQLRADSVHETTPLCPPCIFLPLAPFSNPYPQAEAPGKVKLRRAQAQDHSLSQLSPAIPTPSLRDPSSVILPNVTRGCLKNDQDPKI